MSIRGSLSFIGLNNSPGSFFFYRSSACPLGTAIPPWISTFTLCLWKHSNSNEVIEGNRHAFCDDRSDSKIDSQDEWVNIRFFASFISSDQILIASSTADARRINSCRLEVSSLSISNRLEMLSKSTDCPNVVMSFAMDYSKYSFFSNGD